MGQRTDVSRSWSNGSSFYEGFSFFIRFLRSPLTVGAVVPSSRHLVHKMLEGIDPRARRIVEYGPGSGAFTRAIQRRFAGTLQSHWAFERDSALAGALEKRIPAVSVHNEDAASALARLAPETGRVDAIVSGLPFSLLPRKIAEVLISNSEALLCPGGTLTTYVYLHIFYSPGINRMRRLLARRFSEVSYHVVLRNFPPAVVIRCRK